MVVEFLFVVSERDLPFAFCVNIFSGGDSSTNEDDNDIELEIDDADKTSKKGVEEIVIEDENESSPPETAAEDPETAARKKIEQQLRYELSKAEGLLRNERIQLSKTRDKISESGKNGFFLVKAQVNDFLVPFLSFGFISFVTNTFVTNTLVYSANKGYTTEGAHCPKATRCCFETSSNPG